MKESTRVSKQRERGTTGLVLATTVAHAFITPHPKQHRDVQTTEREQ